MKELKIRDERFSKVEARLETMKIRAIEFAQTRSNFQLEKFIACEEYTPVTRFRHVAHNSYVAMQEVRRSLIERERLERRISDLNDSLVYVKNADLDSYEASRQIEEIEIRLKGLIAEIDYMESICDKLEHDEYEKTGTGFNQAKFEADQPSYWNMRLSNQMHRSQIAAKEGVGEGNYMSALNACEKPILENSPNQITKIPLSINDLAVLALVNRDGVKEAYLESGVPKSDELEKLT